MKIKVIKNGEPIRSYNDPNEIFYNKKHQTVEIRDPVNGKTLDIFQIERRELGWLCPINDSNYEEIQATFYVKEDSA